MHVLITQQVSVYIPIYKLLYISIYKYIPIYTYSHSYNLTHIYIYIHTHALYIYTLSLYIYIGIDPTKEQWKQVSEVVKEMGHVAVFDCAYQVYIVVYSSI